MISLEKAGSKVPGLISRLLKEASLPDPASPVMVILDEPTRGIDAAARGDVYNIIHRLKRSGVAVLLVSSDMEEIEELADRAIIMFQGRITGTFSREELTQDRLTSASFGLKGEKEVPE